MQGTYKLRKFTTDDLSAVTQINQACLPENYTDIFFLDLFKRWADTFLIAEEDHKIVGYILCRVETSLASLSELSITGLTKKGHVVSIAVLAEHRRKGIAKALMTKAMEGMTKYGAKQCYLEVRVTNQEAIGLYKKLGFDIARTLHGYYADGEDAFLMNKKIQ